MEFPTKKNPAPTFFYLTYQPPSNDIKSQCLTLIPFYNNDINIQKRQDFCVLSFLLITIVFSCKVTKIKLNQFAMWQPFWLHLINHWLTLPFDHKTLDLENLCARFKENPSLELVTFLYKDVIAFINQEPQVLKVSLFPEKE